MKNFINLNTINVAYASKNLFFPRHKLTNNHKYKSNYFNRFFL